MAGRACLRARSPRLAPPRSARRCGGVSRRGAPSRPRSVSWGVARAAGTDARPRCRLQARARWWHISGVQTTTSSSLSSTEGSSAARASGQHTVRTPNKFRARGLPCRPRRAAACAPTRHSAQHGPGEGRGAPSVAACAGAGTLARALPNPPSAAFTTPTSPLGLPGTARGGDAGFWAARACGVWCARALRRARASGRRSKPIRPRPAARAPAPFSPASRRSPRQAWPRSLRACSREAALHGRDAGCNRRSWARSLIKSART